MALLFLVTESLPFFSVWLISIVIYNRLSWLQMLWNLGIYFFQHYGLLMDCGNFNILEPNTDRLNFLSCEIPYHSFPYFYFFVIDQLLREFQTWHGLLILFAAPALPFRCFEGLKPEIQTVFLLEWGIGKHEFSIFLKAGIIRPSKSPWVSLILLVSKKEPSLWRF